jgi:hypothetical protein
MEIQIFDNGGRTCDRYTIILGQDVFIMSSNPLSPQGINMWAGTIPIHKWGKCAPLGKPISFEGLSEEVKEAVCHRIQDKIKMSKEEGS